MDDKTRAQILARSHKQHATEIWHLHKNMQLSFENFNRLDDETRWRFIDVALRVSSTINVRVTDIAWALWKGKMDALNWE